MKVIFGLFVLILVIAGIVYMSGGFKMPDPTEQAADLKRNVKTGMNWQDVVDHHQPGKLIPLAMETRDGRRQAIKFDQAQAADAISKGQYPEGFILKYNFSVEEQYEVFFDAQGKVTGEPQKAFTTAALYRGEAFHN